MSEENSTGSNMIWAITFIIIVAMLAGAVYYSGILGAKSKQEIDVDIKGAQCCPVNDSTSLPKMLVGVRSNPYEHFIDY